MELGMIGLGRMGTNMVGRLQRAGHKCVDYDIDFEAVEALVKEGAVGTTSIEDFAKKLTLPRAVWMMVPAAVVDPTCRVIGHEALWVCDASVMPTVHGGRAR